MERIAIYLRLSKEDDLIRDESNSITNQRELIMDYIRRDKKLRKLEVIELKDDGYSGKNLNRPGMQQLLEMVRKQQVSCIIVKDMSRFSRDYLVLGQYTEQILPFMGIRFIAINDSYDSSECEGGVGEIDVAFKALLYDFYSEDLSQKVKSALTVRKEQGKFMNVYAPYGYRKDPDDRHKLVIDPEGAEVVRRIFAEYAEGKGILTIARDLNSDGIDAPAAHIRKRDGRDYFRREAQGNSWSNFSVSRILRNEVYGGTAVYHKAHNKGVGAGGGIYYPREEWKRIENMYPVLIDEETYHRVREKLARNTKAAAHNPAHILKGKIYCGGCGYCMLHTWSGAGSYKCNRRYTLPDSEDCVSSIRDADLETILLELIREKTQRRIGMQPVLEERAKAYRKRIEKAKKHLRDMEESYRKIDADLFHAYEAYREGLTERETYLQQKETYEAMLTRLEEKKKLQSESITSMEEESPVPERWSPDSEYLQIEKLDRPLIELLIRKVIVYKDHTIEVIWNFKSED